MVQENEKPKNTRILYKLMGNFLRPDLDILRTQNDIENQSDDKSFWEGINEPDYFLRPTTEPNLFKSLHKPNSRPLRWG